jgi:hypothetical protein
MYIVYINGLGALQLVKKHDLLPAFDVSFVSSTFNATRMQMLFFPFSISPSMPNTSF